MEEALQTAIGFEWAVRDVYRDAAKDIADPAGRRLFSVLADEEQDHLTYLTDSLQRWRDTGRLPTEALRGSIPTQTAVDAAVAKLEHVMDKEDRGDEVQMLTKALDIELKTSEFYRRMVEELPAVGRQLFARFLEIEQGHLAIVQTELDYLNKAGYWFDYREFDFEGE
jgi:rubrerythrin